jgi:hypothetical protein
MSPQYSEMGENLPGNGPGSAEANNAHHYEGLGDTGSIVIVLLLSSALSSHCRCRCRRRCRRLWLQEPVIVVVVLGCRSTSPQRVATASCRATPCLHDFLTMYCVRGVGLNLDPGHGGAPMCLSAPVVDQREQTLKVTGGHKKAGNGYRSRADSTDRRRGSRVARWRWLRW